MKRKIVKAVLCMCLGLALAGCQDAGTGNEADPGEKVQESVHAGGASESGEGRQEAADDQEAEGQQEAADGQESEGRQEAADGQESAEDSVARNMRLDEMKVEAMNLENAYQRAAFFADWAYYGSMKNTLVSPLSLNFALGMALEGASGQTAQQLQDYLGRKDYTSYVGEYMERAESYACDKGDQPYAEEYSFHYEIANSLWINERHRIQEAYRKQMEHHFRAEVAPADFINDKTATAEKINAWCSDKTHGMIPNVVKPTDLSAELRAVLINSLYFESPWAERWQLAENTFTDFQGKETTQEMLIGKGNAYYENDKAIAFGKNYYNGFRFIGILPKEEGEFNVLDLDLEGLLASESYDYIVQAVMPKLNFETTVEDVVEILQSQGVTVPFTMDAQFDQIIENDNLYISKILQKCKIELDENGTKAAAVTAMMMRATAVFEERQRKEVKLDRPFAFLIYDTAGEEIVFVGKVTTVE